MTHGKKTWLDIVLESSRVEFGRLPAEPVHKICAIEEIMLPVTDGSKLATYIRRPIGNGPFPTIAMRSCYPHQDPLLQLYAEEYSRRGFAFVWQYCRGTGRSEGEWVPNIHERPDGKDFINWLAAQDWSAGIGYWGNSYLALTGWAIADLVPDKVKTLYLTHYGTDRFTSAYQCGLMRQDVLTAWALGNTGQNVKADYQDSLRFRPHIDVDEELWGIRLDWYRDWITSTSRSDEYWNSGFWHELQEIPARVHVPVYLGEGWYDHHLGSSFKTWEKMSLEAKQHSILRIGPWNHGFQTCVQDKPLEHAENSDIINAYHWFDQILRREELPAGGIKAYQIGADCWQDLPKYPFKSERSETFYLQAGSDNSNGRLSRSPAEVTEQTRYVYDPENPVFSHGAESLLATMKENGSLQQPSGGWRDDVVSFVSEPLAKDLDILGKIKVILQVASTADDTAFSAKIMEIGPEGQAYNIRSGISTLAYRKSSEQDREVYVPATQTEITIELWDISWKLRSGCRLRVDISSSDFPQYAVHSNYAGIWSMQDRVRKAEQTILTGSLYPSRIVLPIQSSCEPIGND